MGTHPAGTPEHRSNGESQRIGRAARCALIPIALALLCNSCSAAYGAENPSSAKGCLLENGLAYGPFRDGQDPGANHGAGIYPDAAQIEDDLKVIAGLTRRIRIYGTQGSYADIPGIARKLGIHVTQGIYLGKYPAANDREIQAALKLARAGLVDRIVVGNENLTSGSLSKEALVNYIRQVREELLSTTIPVGAAETWPIWQSNLDLADEVDLILVHIYPFWEKRPIEGAMADVLQRWTSLNDALSAKYPGRNLVIEIGETGWPSSGQPLQKGVIPSPENQRKFLENFMRVACARSIPFYYFEAFDEEWKWQESLASDQGEVQLPRNRTFSGQWVGSSWGLFQSNGILKPHFTDLFGSPSVDSRRQRDILVNGRLATYYDLGVDSSAKQHHWLTPADGSLRIAYPAGQQWGTVFVTVGKPSPRPRPWKDFSEFDSLSIEIRGEKGGETVDIGLMSYADPATGKERKLRLTNLDTAYRVHDIPLCEFSSPHLSIPKDLKQIYVPVEFVFAGPEARTIHVRNVYYRRSELRAGGTRECGKP